MYEENIEPLPNGDFAQLFAGVLSAIERDCRPCPTESITHANVFQGGRQDVQRYFATICRRLLLPGSTIGGMENLTDLTNLALQGNSCIICMNHRSNLDVPTLRVLLEDFGDLKAFHRIIWIAGRKLQEDAGATRMLVQAFNRVIVSPPSWMKDDHSDEEMHEAHQINIAAHRAIHGLRQQGWVFALFPGATRIRPNDTSTRQAIPETDSYLKSFDYMLLGRIDGCTLPATRDRDFTHETPKLDRVRYTFGPILRTDEWRAAAARRFAELDQRTASARAMIVDIETVCSA